jgi:thymidylate synthase
MRYHTLQEAYEGTRHYLRYDGDVIATKSSKGDSRAIELLNQSITIDDVCQINIYNPKRKFNVRYALLEFMWYLSMDPKVRNIGKAASTWKDIADIDGVVHSNYGVCLHQGWDRVVNELVRFPESRRAVIALNQPDIDYGMKDVPCTMFVQFFVRDDKLHLIWNMRSSDFAFGFCNDVAVGMLFLQMMRNELMERTDIPWIGLGSFTYNATSLHCYEPHWHLLFDNYTTEVRDKYELVEEFTWGHVLQDMLYLPSRDIELEQMWDMVDTFEQENFVGGRIMSIDKSILLDAHSIVYKNADGHDYGSFDQNMQDACNFAMVMTGHHVTMDMAYALMVGLKLAREKQVHKRDNMVDVCGYMEGWSEYKEKQAWAKAKNEAEKWNDPELHATEQQKREVAEWQYV